jgi:hypothetical protein
MKTTEGHIEAIYKELKEINQRLAGLENTWKLEPKNPFQYDIDPHFGVSKCQKCGMEFKGITNYYCPTYECPMSMFSFRS